MALLLFDGGRNSAFLNNGRWPGRRGGETAAVLLALVLNDICVVRMVFPYGKTTILPLLLPPEHVF